MSGWSKLLLSGRLQEPDITKGLSAVERGAALQARLLQELLELTQSLEDETDLQREIISIPQLLEELQTTLNFQASDLPQVSVYANKEKLKHALSNLISACVDSSPPGPIRVSASESYGRVEIIVRGGFGESRPRDALVSLEQPDLFSATRLGLLYAASVLGWFGGEVRTQEENGAVSFLIIFSSASSSTGFTR
jgi:C4-dicarboxylate-specific signal transduction histidine kinase